MDRPQQTTRVCEKCKKAKATTQCKKDSSTAYWWYCEACFKNIVGEEGTSQITHDLRGFPDTSMYMAADNKMMSLADFNAKYPRGPRGDPRNFERTNRLCEWALKVAEAMEKYGRGVVNKE